MFYPVYLNLKGKRAVVIGGGEVAERKVESLLETGALISVVSPEVTPRLSALADEKRVELHKRAYRRGDCSGAALVLSATDDADVSTAVWNEARTVGTLVNTADQPSLCDFILARARPEIRRRVQHERNRKALHYRILDSDVITLLEQNDSNGAERRLQEIIEDFVCPERTL